MEAAPRRSPDDGDFRLVGTSRRRTDAPERIIGQARYVGDLPLPGALHARLVTSPYAAARVLSIDASQALAQPGVTHVLTARDLPAVDIEQAVANRRILLALDYVLYAGQPVAVVLAETEALAEDGASAVRVEYEPSVAVVDPDQARQADAPVVRRSEASEASKRSVQAGAAGSPNVTHSSQLRRGDVEQGFREAAVIVEDTFRTSSVHQGYTEPLGCAVAFDQPGRLTVYASTRGIFRTRDQISSTLGLADFDVTVIPTALGGAFGGKFELIEVTVAAVALAAQRSIRLTYTRTDELVAADPAPQAVFRVKAGARSDGSLAALQADVLFDAGAYPGTPIRHASQMLGSLYRWDNLLIDSTEVVTNKTGPGAYRAPGAAQAAFALECVMDELARQLDLDPLELRLANAAGEGDLRADGSPWPPLALRECLERAVPLYRSELERRQPGEGVGVAAGAWLGGLEPAGALCRLNSDGTLLVTVGAVDMTGTNTSLEIIAAEAFGLSDPARVRVVTGGTDMAPYAGPSGGSKVTYTVGPAVIGAASEAREQVLQVTAAELDVSVDDLEIVDGRVQVRGVPGQARSLVDIYRLSASFGAKYEPILGRGRAAVPAHSPMVGVQIVRLWVDQETGHVIPRSHIVVQDVGRAINPAEVAGQIMGGAVQGLGWALNERLVWDEAGTPITDSFAIPRAPELPSLAIELVEVPSPLGPYGAKGVAEPPIVPGIAAVSNAIRAATGARLTETPFISERVLAKIRSDGSSAPG